MRSRTLLIAALFTTLGLAAPTASADGTECGGVTGVGEVCYDYFCPGGGGCVIDDVHVHLLENPTPGCTGAPSLLQVCVIVECYGDNCIITDVYVCLLGRCT